MFAFTKNILHKYWILKTFFFLQCKNHYDTIIGELNKTYLFRNYPVFSSLKWRCLVLWVLFLAFACIWTISLLLSITNGSILKDEIYAIINFTLGVPLLCTIFICGFPIIYGYRRLVVVICLSFLYLSHSKEMIFTQIQIC